MIKEEEFNLTVLDDDEVSLAEISNIPEMLTDTDAIGRLSLVDEKKAKQAVSNLKKRVSFISDQRKLMEAKKTLDNLANSGDIIADPEVWARVKANINTPMDLKFIAEFREKETKNLQNLMRMDSVDGQGTAGIANISIGIQDTSGNVTAVHINKNNN